MSADVSTDVIADVIARATHRVDTHGRVYGRPTVRPDRRLTSRHVAVIRLISYGWTNERIAAQLGICLRTVKQEVTHCCRVLRARNRAHLAATAIRRRIIP